MFSPIQYVFITAIVLYLLDSVWEVGSIFNPGKFNRRLADYFILSGLSVHCAFLIVVSVRSGTLPVSTLFESSTFYLSLIVLITVVLKFLYRLQALTPFVMPVITGFSIMAVTLVKNDLVLTSDLKKFWLFAHIIPIFMGYASFTVSFIFSTMYLTQERQLKKKAFGSLFESLPSLETLDTLMWKTITFGFPLLTIGLISGTVWAKTTNILGLLWYLDPKVLLGSLTWLIYAAILHLRLGASFHGTKVALVTIAGFVIVILTFIGPFLMGHKHAYEKSSVTVEEQTIPVEPVILKAESY